MRIIAGSARGRTLLAPKGMDTRPTLDRVRESLFSILQPRLPEAVVLDLFAGSGALGLEALSRGAKQAVFVDRARAAQEAISRNIHAAGMEEKAELLCCDWRMAITRLKNEALQFTLLFIDPPYRMPHAEDMLRTLRDSGLLAEDALTVYEHAQQAPPTMEGWTLRDQRRYGDTVISFLSRRGAE